MASIFGKIKQKLIYENNQSFYQKKAHYTPLMQDLDFILTLLNTEIEE